MRLTITLGLTLALALACGGDAGPEAEPQGRTDADHHNDAPEAVPAGACCCATNAFAGAAAPKLPATQEECGTKPWEEGCVADGLCHLDKDLDASLVDARGGEVGVARTVSFVTFRDEAFDLVIPAGAAISHPKSQLIVTRGPAAELERSLANALAQAGYQPEGEPEKAADAQTETYGDYTQSYTNGKSQISLSVAATCDQVQGLACIWVR
jgi:hypothetical protein